MDKTLSLIHILFDYILPHFYNEGRGKPENYFFIFTKAIPLTDEFILLEQMMFETEGTTASPV